MPGRTSEHRERYLASLYDEGLSVKSIMESQSAGQRVVTRAVNTYSKMRQSTIGRNSTSKFEVLDDVAAYWLGFIAADGHLRADSHRYELVVEVNRKDEEHLDSLVAWIGFGSKIYRKRDNCVVFVFTSKQLVNNLSNWIAVGNKTERDNFSGVPSEHRVNFVRGYFDGDGSTTGRQFSITSCPQTLLPLAGFVAEVVGEAPRIYQKSGNLAQSAHWNKDATRNFKKTFDGIPRLERKWNV